MRVLLCVVLFLGLLACGTNQENKSVEIRVVNPALTVAYNNEFYNEELRISGGQRAYTLRISKGKLPDGIALQGSRLTGTPKVALKSNEQKSFEFTVEITDSGNSNKFQDLKLEVRNLPPPSLEWSIPPTQVRDEVRLPFVLKIPKNVRSMRVAIQLPNTASLKRLEPGAGRPLMLSKLEGNVLRIDAALTEAIPSVRPATVFYVVLALSKPTKLEGKIGFELRAKKEILSKAALELPKPATPNTPNTPNVPTPPNTPTNPTEGEPK